MRFARAVSSWLCGSPSGAGAVFPFGLEGSNRLEAAEERLDFFLDGALFAQRIEEGEVFHESAAEQFAVALQGCGPSLEELRGLVAKAKRPFIFELEGGHRLRMTTRRGERARFEEVAGAHREVVRERCFDVVEREQLEVLGDRLLKGLNLVEQSGGSFFFALVRAAKREKGECKGRGCTRTASRRLGHGVLP